MKQVIIIHGTGGKPEENWHMWLGHELKKAGHDVLIPRFSTPKGQTLEQWTDDFNRHGIKLTDQTVLVGHSVGATFVLRLLEQSEVPVYATFLVSGFSEPLNNPKYDSLVESFIEQPFDWDKIKKNVGKVFVFHGDDDPAVNPEQAKMIAKRLGGKLTIIPGGKHLSESAGFIELPDLAKALNKVLE